MSIINRILAILFALCLLSAPASADTVRHYSNVVQAVPGAGASSLQMSSVDLVRFLVNDCDGATYDCQSGAATVGPGWTLVRAHSNAAYEDTPTPTDVDSLASATAWAGDGSGLAAGDWVVLESATSTGGGGANHFQLYLEYDSTTTWRFLMLPLADFVTSSVSPPVWTAGDGNACDTIPGVGGDEACKGVGAGENSLVAFTTLAGASTMSIVADEDVVIILRDDGASPDWIYVGGVDGNLSTSTPADDRPFVINDTPASVFTLVSASPWNRLAPDDTTVLTVGYPCQLRQNNTQSDDFPGTYNGAWQLWPVYLYFDVASHYHVTGSLQYVRQGSDDLGIAGRTINSAAWACRGSDAANSPICLSWDGSAYP